jgi:hypothetical protein
MKHADPISKKARDVFDHSVDTLDIATANRLRLLRRDTLTTNTKTASVFRRWWLPMTAVGALSLVLSVSLWMRPQVNNTPLDAYDSSLLLSEDDTDAEMLNWLAEAPIEVANTSKGNL